ncbi:unnamed protein product [Lepeophtheirus salmonis]|uniref:(salmon louse) hypothetical protein n=1 Tax=Lepeophtheirus salmonis TaxID=72036 RepID=A0A7R8CSG9_LEPSM|nr:unnamed protein product [Lepeophtheirus salmonis]CAF2915953.1 unnamed protein product [Lepeophtheirus salmonis]
MKPFFFIFAMLIAAVCSAPEADPEADAYGHRANSHVRFHGYQPHPFGAYVRGAYPYSYGHGYGYGVHHLGKRDAEKATADADPGYSYYSNYHSAHPSYVQRPYNYGYRSVRPLGYARPYGHYYY